ncbi:MAG: RdgB/HAM1 family non-canonical purine NTP pyrophosphatase [Oscillospiraceae bacterium]|nr:RdgB/HAM1 family non-canonical purine NTP pyrophosphatase [Oscillospiraceae bacterium]
MAQFRLVSTNEGKLRQFREMGLDVEPLSLDVVEDGETFEANALLKAKAGVLATGQPCIADDSGLCVTALGGRPGVYSSRYGANDLERNSKLLAELLDASDRSAKYVSAIAIAYPDGRFIITRGENDGTIALAPRGSGGFGYDPVFIPDGHANTMAELTPDTRNSLSHRGKAIRNLTSAKIIRVFGGTFDPPHLGHSQYSEQLTVNSEQFTLVIPNGQPPHKELGVNSATALERLELCRLAFPSCVVSDIEISKSGKSYTADTVRELQTLYPGARFTLAIGTDMYDYLPKWYDYEWLRGNVNFEVYDRLVLPVSSTELRELLPKRGGLPFLNPLVYAYIIRHRLYKALPDWDWLRAEALTLLDDKRIPHVLAVERAAVELAERWGVDVDDARTAALLHDCTKNKDVTKQLQFCEEYDIMSLIPGFESSGALTEGNKVLHSFTGAEFSYQHFGVNENVRNAIRWHTTGRAAMTDLELITYLADATDDTRDYPEADKLRKLARSDLRAAMRYALEINLLPLKENDSVIVTYSQDALDYYG